MISLGSSGAIKAVPKGALDIGVASRDLTDAERQRNMTATEYARTPAAITVSSKSGVADITREQRADFLTGELGKCPDGLVIRPVLRQPGDDNSRQLRGLSNAIEAALAIAERRQGLPFDVGDQVVAYKLKPIPGAVAVHPGYPLLRPSFILQRRHGCHESLPGATPPLCIRHHFFKLQFLAAGLLARKQPWPNQGINPGRWLSQSSLLNHLQKHCLCVSHSVFQSKLSEIVSSPLPAPSQGN